MQPLGKCEAGAEEFIGVIAALVHDKAAAIT